jgi:hypothetical protein
MCSRAGEPFAQTSNGLLRAEHPVQRRYGGAARCESGEQGGRPAAGLHEGQNADQHGEHRGDREDDCPAGG